MPMATNEAAAATEDEVSGPLLVRSRHIKKRALKNKSLSVSFNEKDLKDFVTGFHKRKKKRRKEAVHKQEEAERRKRIEQRKKMPSNLTRNMEMRRQYNKLHQFQVRQCMTTETCKSWSRRVNSRRGRLSHGYAEDGKRARTFGINQQEQDEDPWEEEATQEGSKKEVLPKASI